MKHKCYCENCGCEECETAQKETSVSAVALSDGLEGLINEWQEQFKTLDSKVKNWIQVPADARLLGKAEGILMCIEELQDKIKKAD